MEAVKSLDALDKIPDVVARNLDRLPDRQPKEINLLAALQRIDKLEKSKTQHEESLTQLAVDVLELQDKSKSFAAGAAADKTKPPMIVPTPNVPALIVPDIVVTPPAQVPGDPIPPTAPPSQPPIGMGIPDNSYSGVARRGHGPSGRGRGSHGNAHHPPPSGRGSGRGRGSHGNSHHPPPSGRGRRGSGQHHRNRSSDRTQHRRPSAASQQRGPGPLYDANGFRIAMSRKARRTIGRAAASSDLVGAPPPERQIWVSRVSNGTETSMNKYLTDNGVTVKSIEKTSHPSSKFSSYKISIPMTDLHKVYDEIFWPYGIYCKRWYNKVEQNDDDNTDFSDNDLY